MCLWSVDSVHNTCSSVNKSNMFRIHCHLNVPTVPLILTVKKEKPSFLKKPSDLEIFEQEDARFETEIKARPEPTVEWFKGDKKLEPSDRILYEQDGSKYTVTIKEAIIKESGTYNVKATNAAGTMSAAAKLKVKGWSIILVISDWNFPRRQ